MFFRSIAPATAISLLLMHLLSAGLFAQGYNLKMGPVRFNLTGNMGIEYNSNITASGLEPLSDLIFLPGIDMAGDWQITDVNTLNFNFGIAYRKYLNNPELDSGNNFVDIKPDSRLSFDLFAGNFTITLQDELQFSSDPTDAFVVDPSSDPNDPNVIFDVFEFSRFNNFAAIIVNWDASSVDALSFTINRDDTFPLESRFNRARRVEYSFSPAYYRQLSSALRVGVVTSYRVNSYSEPLQNDSSGYSYGVRADWTPSQFLTLSGGISGLAYNFNSEGNNQDNSDVRSVIYDIMASNTLNSEYSHSLGFERAVNFAFIANSNLTHTLQYNFIYTGFNYIDIDGSILYQTSCDSGGISPEDANRFQFSIGTAYQFNPRWKSTIKYTFTDRDSNIPARDYQINQVRLTAFYDF